MLTLARFWNSSDGLALSERVLLLWKYADLPVVPKFKRHRRRQPTVPDWGLVCWGCGSQTPNHWHHIIPISSGGTNILRNFVRLCGDCHLWVHAGHERSLPIAVKKKLVARTLPLVDSEQRVDQGYEHEPREPLNPRPERHLNSEDFQRFNSDLQNKFEAGDGEDYTPEDMRDLWEASFG